MDIKLYEYGLDNSLIEAVNILRAAMGTKLSKRDKDIKIAEAISIIDTAHIMVVVSEPEEQATDEKE